MKNTYKIAIGLLVSASMFLTFRAWQQNNAMTQKTNRSFTVNRYNWG